MADATFTPGYGFVMGMCLKRCSNRGWRCEGCYGFSRLKEKPVKKKKKKEKWKSKDGCSLTKPPSE